MPWKIITKGSLPKKIADDINSRLHRAKGQSVVFKSKYGYHVATFSPTICSICKREIKDISKAIVAGERYAHLSCMGKAEKSFIER